MKCHNGAISGVQVMGKLLVTACFDRLVRCFDLEVSDQLIVVVVKYFQRLELLQVYGGHTDMIFSLVANNGIVKMRLYTVVI